MGPIFGPKIPEHGSIFLKFSEIKKKNSLFLEQIPKHGSIFGAKSLNMGTFFTLNVG